MINSHKNNPIKEKPLILYSALDWGLGHLSRSIPLIRELIDQGWEVIVACNSIQKDILKQELPQLRTVFIEGYDVKYGKSRLSTWIKISLQARKILIKIKKERCWVADFVAKNNIKAVISDNRYGFFHPALPSVFITHQLNVLSGIGRFADRMIQKQLYHFINKFTICWVPDEKDNSLAGKLSHPDILPAVPVKYIGPLSRFNAVKSADTHTYAYAFILSGPEPQRTILENKIVDELKEVCEKCILIRGVVSNESKEINSMPTNISIINYASSSDLENIIYQSRVIVCRPGYTSMMDLLKMRKQCVVIPTPGQTEQEYLAQYLSGKKFCATINQSAFSFSLLKKVHDSFKYQHYEETMELYKEHVKMFTQTFIGHSSKLH